MYYDDSKNCSHCGGLITNYTFESYYCSEECFWNAMDNKKLLKEFKLLRKYEQERKKEEDRKRYAEDEQKRKEEAAKSLQEKENLKAQKKEKWDRLDISYSKFEYHYGTNESEHNNLIQAVKVIEENGLVKSALIMKNLKIGYNEYSLIIDQLESFKIIGPFEGASPRKVLGTLTDLEKHLNIMNNENPDPLACLFPEQSGPKFSNTSDLKSNEQSLTFGEYDPKLDLYNFKYLSSLQLNSISNLSYVDFEQLQSQLLLTNSQEELDNVLKTVVINLIKQRHPAELKLLWITENKFFPFLDKFYNLDIQNEKKQFNYQMDSFSRCLALYEELEKRYSQLNNAKSADFVDYNMKYCNRQVENEGNAYMTEIVGVIDDLDSFSFTSTDARLNFIDKILTFGPAVRIKLLVCCSNSQENVLGNLLKRFSAIFLSRTNTSFTQLIFNQTNFSTNTDFNFYYLTLPNYSEIKINTFSDSDLVVAKEHFERQRGYPSNEIDLKAKLTFGESYHKVYSKKSTIDNSVTTNTTKQSSLDELLKLKELLDQGLIDLDEFALLKKKILMNS